MSLNNKLESDQITCGQIKEYINRMQNKIKSNYEEDFRLLYIYYKIDQKKTRGQALNLRALKKNVQKYEWQFKNVRKNQKMLTKFGRGNNLEKYNKWVPNKFKNSKNAQFFEFTFSLYTVQYIRQRIVFKLLYNNQKLL